ncbi:hypothetical protein [uncultured Maricaulis sp.]|uniref:hypothetical protein n=1 Tax=uncultured Maricaulis sp. TaxID=174710 RepID=UPI0030DCAFD8|tara:strand:- start:7402 stop:8172 length:771 start_codon:yes stop_codon:yes gene_type:complete
MILSRIIHHLKTQNWTAVAIEFVIVIAGVVIGFQVTGWHAERSDRELETYYLERLHADLVGTLEDYFANARWDETQLDAEDIALNALRNCTPADDERDLFIRGLAFAGNINPVPLRWETADELVATGNISLIRDLELRERLARVNGLNQRSGTIIEGARQDTVALRPEITRQVDVTQYDFVRDAGFDARFDFDALCNDLAFVGTLSAIHVRSRLIFGFTGEQLERIAELESYLATSRGLEPWEAPDDTETSDGDAP